ncbi:hypothetical protein A4G26_21445 [Mycobacterium kansasii]|uniref:Molybdopterin synthase sulfur carrier subunit n=1 Tax=Mycobacterium innocens TaxID=2341083 RepID=A0A498QFK4_9MYCO|nr:MULTISPECIES: MoaD/ThiS family protein [Mycobacterium]KZS76806.1 hypothetical protein A4G26_21445 [Mycobacterium kansasii]VBA43554.1 hypothetical protein LAUMK13_04586 [Mycobacterium innocens]
MPVVTVRYFGAARAATGRHEEAVPVRAGDTVAQVVSAIGGRHGERMADLLQRCSFLLDEMAVTSRRCQVAHLSTLDVLPPFAGG